MRTSRTLGALAALPCLEAPQEPEPLKHGFTGSRGFWQATDPGGADPRSVAAVAKSDVVLSA